MLLQNSRLWPESQEIIHAWTKTAFIKQKALPKTSKTPLGDSTWGCIPIVPKASPKYKPHPTRPYLRRQFQSFGFYWECDSQNTKGEEGNVKENQIKNDVSQSLNCLISRKITTSTGISENCSLISIIFYCVSINYSILKVFLWEI